MNNNENLDLFSWFVETASRQDAENFLNRCEHGRFIVRRSSMPGCLALSHKLPTQDIGHALIQSSDAGWTITGSEKSFPTVEGLLRSRTLTFPKPGELGAPHQMTFADTSSGGKVASQMNSHGGAPARQASPMLPPPPDPVQTTHQTTSAPPAAQNNAAVVTPLAPEPFPVSAAIDKVLACLVNPNIVTLELFSMNLTRLPSEVNDLVHLQQLYLSNNAFTVFPMEICSLVNLKTLWIQANQLTSLPPQIGKLSSLEKFKLSNNRINARTGFPAEMAQMTGLKEVWIENNHLDIFPPVLLNVRSMTRIWLDHNQIREIPPGIQQLSELERLSMNKNLVRAVPPELGRCSNLEKLWLIDNELAHVAPEINRCVKLHTLALANNRIAVAPQLNLPGLVDLRLENNPCGGVDESKNVPAHQSVDNSRRPSGGGFRQAPQGPAASMVQMPATSSKAPVQKKKSVFGFLGSGSKEDAQKTLHEAINSGEEKRVKKIMGARKKRHINLAQLDQDGLTPLNLAVKTGHEGVVHSIVHYATPDEINLKDKFGYTPLHWAVRGTNDAILHRLLKCNGIKVDVQNNDNNTPLHYFCEKNHSPDCERIGQMLIEKGAVVNQTNNNGETPLHKAIFNNQVRLMMVRLLIRNGADVNVLTMQRQSPLQYAVRLRREDLVSMLLKAGARLDLRSTDGLTAYEVAVKENCEKIASLLHECEKLQQWLHGMELDQYFPTFVNEDISYDTLADLRESDLDRLKITTTGHRMKLMRACDTLRAERQLNTMAAHEQKLALEQPPQFTSNADGAEAEWMADLTAGMDLREGEHIAFGDVELLEELGSGAAGKVYKGLFKGKHVAVKVLKELKDNAEIEDFKKELEIMTSIRDPHMVFFYGVCVSPKMCMVMELCARKSLFHVLNRDGLKIGWPQALEWGAQSAAGTACLHKHDIVHRDLKSLNLLVTENWVIKVADFGLARFNNDGNLETLNKMRGTMAYCPPEAYFAQPFNYKSDVYSLAIILWELVNRCLKSKYEAPFSEYKNLTMDFQIIIQVAKSHLRPSIPDRCPAEARQIIETCWQFERDDRPVAEDVVTQLRDIARIYEGNAAAWDSTIQEEK